MPEQRELDAAGGVQAVEEQLAEPLLVDPLLSLRPDREAVSQVEAVVGDLVPAEDREPAVGLELVR